MYFVLDLVQSGPVNWLLHYSTISLSAPSENLSERWHHHLNLFTFLCLLACLVKWPTSLQTFLPAPWMTCFPQLMSQLVNLGNKMSCLWHLNLHVKGGSPGLVVMGGYSRSEGRGFESQRHLLAGHDIFSHWFVVKIVVFFWGGPKINEKEAGVGPIVFTKNLRMKNNLCLY